MLLDDTMMQQGPQCLTFSCSFPSTSGRGFIEVHAMSISLYVCSFSLFYITEFLNSFSRLKIVIKAVFPFPLLLLKNLYVLRFECWSMN